MTRDSGATIVMSPAATPMRLRSATSSVSPGASAIDRTRPSTPLACEPAPAASYIAIVKGHLAPRAPNEGEEPCLGPGERGAVDLRRLVADLEEVDEPAVAV